MPTRPVLLVYQRLDEAIVLEHHLHLRPGEQMVNSQRVHRRLAAILAADVVGFSALMEQDEEGTLARVKQLRRDLIEPRVQEHDGRVFKTTGDGLLAEFPSPVEAVRCAVEVQETLATEQVQEASRSLQLRIGINLGDIIVEEDGDVYGDGVNIAARLQQLTKPGAVWISGSVYDHIGEGSKRSSRTGGSSRSRTSLDQFGYMRGPGRIPRFFRAHLNVYPCLTGPLLRFCRSQTWAVIPNRSTLPTA